MTVLAFLTGKRGGYDAMRPTLQMAAVAPDVDVHVIATDQHTMSQFGLTQSRIHHTEGRLHLLPTHQDGSSAIERAKALGRLRLHLPNLLNEINPDVLLLYGDRGESLEAASTATIMGIPIAHAQGGDVSGSIDEQVRHSISKLAHIHFPSGRASANRLVRMGEEPWRIRITGDHHLDPIRLGHFASPDEVHSAFPEFFTRPDPPIVVLQHSETTSPEASYEQMTETLAATAAMSSRKKVVVYPCSDVGFEGIIRAIDEYSDHPDFVTFPNIDSYYFLGILLVSGLIVGNSSCGIIEAPFAGVPSVTIGRRQIGRETLGTVFRATHHVSAILESCAAAIRQGLEPAQRHISPLAGTTAAELLLRGIRELVPHPSLLVKRFYSADERLADELA